MSDGLDSGDRDVDVVVVVGHPPHRVLDAEAIGLALNVGVDGIAGPMSSRSRCQGAAAGVVGAESLHTTDGLHTWVGGGDVLREVARIGDKPLPPTRGRPPPSQMTLQPDRR